MNVVEAVYAAKKQILKLRHEMFLSKRIKDYSTAALLEGEILKIRKSVKEEYGIIIDY